MANKITKYFEQETGKKVTNADLLNVVRSRASSAYQNDIPEMGSMKPINHANVPYTQYELHANEFFNVLINRIGSVVVKALSFENSLKVFKSESFEYGETLQEIYVGLANATTYNAKDNKSPFAFSDTQIEIFYHDINREDLYERSITKEWTQKAFTSERSFDEFIDKMLGSLMSSDELDEYELMKGIIPKMLIPVTTPSGVITSPATEIDITLPDYVITFNKELNRRSKLFSVPSRTRFENGAGVPMTTPIDEQYLIIDANFATEIDNLLANAFNMDKAAVLAKKIVVDNFEQYTGTGDYNGVYPIAILCSKDSFIFKDKLIQLTNIFNPRTLGYNYFLHHHETLSYSLIANSHVYYTKQKA